MNRFPSELLEIQAAKLCFSFHSDVVKALAFTIEQTYSVFKDQLKTNFEFSLKTQSLSGFRLPSTNF